MQIREKALQWLSRRDYSARELVQRLISQYDVHDIEPVLLQLKEQGLQSDERFAQMLVRSRARKGLGPLRIRSELKQKGVAGLLIDAVMAESGEDWFDVARRCYQKRFRQQADDPREQARQYRFLQYRGFTRDQIQFALHPE